MTAEPWQLGLLWFGVSNAAAFALYGWDKWCARRERRRIPEATLLLTGLLGGWLGSWIGMRTWRHKTRKTGFKLKLGAITTLWLAGLGWTALRLSGGS